EVDSLGQVGTADQQPFDVHDAALPLEVQATSLLLVRGLRDARNPDLTAYQNYVVPTADAQSSGAGERVGRKHDPVVVADVEPEVLLARPDLDGDGVRQSGRWPGKRRVAGGSDDSLRIRQ